MSTIKQLNTIDLDYCDKETLRRTIDKILLCKNLVQIQSKPSSNKGYHLLMLCNKNCDICRLVYDDQRRYAIDTNIRKPQFKNLLWDNKEKSGKNIRELMIEMIFK